jgi:hypothetical protein
MLHTDDDGDFVLLPTSGYEIEVDTACLDEAVCRWKRGERKEALHWLERALGRDFGGLGELAPEHLR